MINNHPTRLAFVFAAIVALTSFSQGQSAPAAGQDNLGYWLNRAAPATGSTGGANQPSQPATLAGTQDSLRRDDALPGAVELSDGKILGGYIFTTRDSPWAVYLEDEKIYRRIPPIAVLSITAVVVEETTERQWRWKEMGSPEKVYTGASYPTRRLKWKFNLIDGTAVTGDVKGQPLWIDRSGKRLGPFILSERTKGPEGSDLKDLVYVKRVVISRRAMEEVLKTGARE